MAALRPDLRNQVTLVRMDLISSETAPTIDAFGIRFTLADRDGDYAYHVLRGFDRYAR